jgi:hypothetical protein
MRESFGIARMASRSEKEPTMRTGTIVSLVGVLFTVTLVQAQLSAPFTRVTTGDLVTIPAWYFGGEWGDYDDDGYLDLFVGGTIAATRNYLYHNNQDGTFTLIEDAKMPKVPSNQHGAAWGDYDNDGHLDLVVTSGNPEITHNALYHNNGDGSFTAVTEGPIYSATVWFHAPSWFDYDNDGLLDLFIAGHNATNRLFRNNGDGTFTNVTEGILVTDPSNSAGHVWFDYDGDGKFDLLVDNFAPYTRALYRNEGGGVFSKITDSGLSDPSADTWGVCAADYDNDGFVDVLFGNDGTTSLFHNQGNGTFAPVTDGPIATQTMTPGVFPACAWGDYDNDGFLDLLLSRACFPESPACQPLTVLLFHNNGDGSFTSVDSGPVATANVTQANGPAWGDYDNDGFLDLFMSQGILWSTPGNNLLFHNDGNTNAWLKVKLIGTISNRSGIGATVRVKATYRGAERWQMRTVSGGGEGEGNQPNALESTFGMGDATIVNTVRVEWPSGKVQELHDVTPRQLLTITEPPCGNGIVHSDELCDGPCCDQCQAFRPTGEPCASDLNLCTADVCDGSGSCTHVPMPNPECAMPITPGKAMLDLRRLPGKPSKSRLKFKWGGGAAVALDELGTAPAAGSPLYELCIYDADGGDTTQAFRAQVPAAVQCDGRPCWKRLGQVGWKFASESGNPDGITGLVLRSGLAGKAKMKVTGKGARLVMPDLPLVQNPSVVAQLRTSSGKCWGATFSSSLDNGTLRFKSRAD